MLRVAKERGHSEQGTSPVLDATGTQAVQQIPCVLLSLTEGGSSPGRIL